MGVKESLVLDHFYISASTEDFAKLVELKNILGATNHSKVVTTDDSWEGIYAGCRTRVYFEVLNARRPGGFGLCFSPYNPIYVDANKIREELSHLPWQHGRRDTEAGGPWYDWMATCDYRDTEKTVFNAWIMRYYLQHKDWKIPIPKPSVDRYRSVRMSLGRSHLEDVKTAASWFPGDAKFSEKEISFRIPDRDGSDFSVQIDLVPGNSHFEFREMKFRLADPSVGKVLTSRDFGSYRFEVEGESAVLLRKP